MPKMKTFQKADKRTKDRANSKQEDNFKIAVAWNEEKK